VTASVLIVDDHPVIRAGLKAILGQAGFDVRAEAADGEQALDLVRRNSIDVITLDISLPGKNGFQVLQELKSERPDIAVLILSVSSDEEYRYRALRAGAAGYLNKNCACGTLVWAVRKIARGGHYWSPPLAKQLPFGFLEIDRCAKELLSRREYQILCMIASGKTIGTIASELELSVNTISTYRSRGMEKLQLRNKSALIRYSIKHAVGESETPGKWREQLQQIRVRAS
jgi:two-component system invasion response regulator UvrY